jgi:hypothetical protein
VFRRDENWFPQSYFLGEVVHFKSVDFHLPIEEIYLRVDNEDMQMFLQKQTMGV